MSALRLGTALVLCLGLLATAHAEDRDVDLAKQYFRLGEKLYQRGNYTKALEHFKASYENSKLPDLLYNMARCYESLNQLKKALEHYALYLKERKGDNAIVRAKMANLKRRMATHQPPPPIPEKKSAPPAEKPAGALKLGDDTQRPPVDPLPQEKAPGKSPVMKITGWALVGVGAVLLGVGTALGASASGKASDIEDAAARGEPWADHAGTYDDGESAEAAAIGTLITGGVAALVGATLLVLDWTGGKKEQSAATLRVVPALTAKGAGIGALIRF